MSSSRDATGETSQLELNPNPTIQLVGDEEQDGTGALSANESTQTAPFSSPKEILKVIETVERDSTAIANSFTALLASLRLSLSQATSSTMDHMSCFSDAAGRLQECVLDSSTKGNRYINSCLRLNEEMKGMEALATQLFCNVARPPCGLTKNFLDKIRKVLRRHADALDSAVNKITRFP